MFASFLPYTSNSHYSRYSATFPERDSLCGFGLAPPYLTQFYPYHQTLLSVPGLETTALPMISNPLSSLYGLQELRCSELSRLSCRRDSFSHSHADHSRSSFHHLQSTIDRESTEQSTQKNSIDTLRRKASIYSDVLLESKVSASCLPYTHKS